MQRKKQSRPWHKELIIVKRPSFKSRFSLNFSKKLSNFLPQEESSSQVSNARGRYSSKRVIRTSSSIKSLEFIQLTKEWSKIVGEFLAKNTIPSKIIKKELVILTKHSIFSQELSYMESAILDNIKRSFLKLSKDLNTLRFQTDPKFFVNFTPNLEYSDTPIGDHERHNSVGDNTLPSSALTMHPESPQYKKLKREANKEFAFVESEDARKYLMELFLQLQLKQNMS